MVKTAVACDVLLGGWFIIWSFDFSPARKIQQNSTGKHQSRWQNNSVLAVPILRNNAPNGIANLVARICLCRRITFEMLNGNVPKQWANGTSAPSNEPQETNWKQNVSDKAHNAKSA
jgi:hypothetical protein